MLVLENYQKQPDKFALTTSLLSSAINVMNDLARSQKLES